MSQHLSQLMQRIFTAVFQVGPSEFSNLPSQLAYLYAYRSLEHAVPLVGEPMPALYRHKSLGPQGSRQCHLVLASRIDIQQLQEP